MTSEQQMLIEQRILADMRELVERYQREVMTSRRGYSKVWRTHERRPDVLGIMIGRMSQLSPEFVAAMSAAAFEEVNEDDMTREIRQEFGIDN